MPGLSQLKQFNSDVLSIGDEARLRAARGEQPVRVPIPRGVADVDDSEEFVLGIPDADDDDATRAGTAEQPLDEDFSDITGARTPAAAVEGAAAAPAAIDLSNVLNPVASGAGIDQADSIPDLSLFEEPVEEAPPEPEPEEPSIADLGLEALLKSTGFRETAETDAVEELADTIEPELVPEQEAGAPIDFPDAFSAPPAAAPDVFSFEDAAVVPDIPGDVREDTDAAPDEGGFDGADDFAFSGTAIDLTEGLPADVAERDEAPADTTARELEVAADSATDFDDVFPDFETAAPVFADDADGMPSPSAFNEEQLVDAETRAADAAVDAAVFTAASTADTAILSEQEPSFSGMDFSFDDALSGDAVSAPPLDGTSFDVPDFGTDDSFVQDALAAGDDAATESTEPLEVFDTSDIEGLDFNIPETDSQIAGTATDFELGSSSDFADDFEIPGFSDTNVVPETKGKKSVVSPSPAEPTADDDQKNTLTDEQYQQFLTNLSGYPLNVRIAVEDLIVRNEFTDDAEFEVIKKILNRAPARQVAAHLERMLDISIPVPRDFERRTAAEYEALKSSFQYQLKNKIVPVVAVCVALVLVLFGLFELSYNFIYKPIRAHNLYRHGYALIESHDYPQSEILFTEATNYDLQKRWFYRYARAYRANRQYDRAEKMYRAILYTFNYDKQAGLEYADMEVTDRANYPKAEEILRRDVLDHHVNDADGILALGDVFLAWATEQDETKFEDARLQYATLIDLYGTTDAYLARMMRYFIRTDNLREVLQLKEHFFPKKKSLGAADWTELSGYLLDKLFGQLAPAEEYLRRNIEDVKELLTNAITADPTNPVALYNMSRYYVQMNNSVAAIAALQQTIAAFDRAPSLSVRDAYRYIDTYRLLGEEYAAGNEYLKARETYTGGIAFYQSTHELSGLAGTESVGVLYADMGDIDYFIAGDYDNAYRNYTESVSLGNDTASVRYRLGYIEYARHDYRAALNSFLRAAAGAPGDNNVLLALGNTLSLRGDNYAAEGYYSRLMSQLELRRAQEGILLPQVTPDQTELIEMMLKASNNLGVTLFRLAERTGSSAYNAQAMVHLSQSMRAWDALTRNQTTMIRLGGSNLAEQNMSYMSRPLSTYEPAIYTELPRTLMGEEDLAG